MTFVLREVCSIGIWAADGWRALVNRRKGRCTNLEIRKFVVVDFDGIPWVTVPSGHTLPSLSKLSQWCELNRAMDTSVPVQQSWGQGSGR